MPGAITIWNCSHFFPRNSGPPDNSWSYLQLPFYSDDVDPAQDRNRRMGENEVIKKRTLPEFILVPFIAGLPSEWITCVVDYIFKNDANV